jgi:hypothetical protein
MGGSPVFLSSAEMFSHYREVRSRLMGVPAADAAPETVPDVPALAVEVIEAVAKKIIDRIDVGSGRKQRFDMRLIGVIENRLTIRTITRVVCEHYGISMIDVISKRRTHAIVLPRQICYYLSKILTTKSLPEIGRVLGDKDHTSVLHGCRRIEALALVDVDLAENLRKIILRIKERCGQDFDPELHGCLA